MRQLLLSVLAAILVLVAQSFGPWVQSVHPSSQDRLNKLTPLMSAIEDAPSVEVLTKLLKATEMLVQSKQSEIDILKESKQSQIDILKESLKELKDVWKDLDQTKETTILNLRTELATTLANHYAVEFTRIIIEHAALRTQAIRDATKKLTASDATIKLSAELFLDQDIDSNNICDQTNEWLEKLVYPSPLTLRLKKDVIAALKKNQFKHLSPRHQYIADAPNGLYFGDGPDPDRFAQALIVLKAQYLGAYNHEVILLNFEKKPTWILLDGDIFPYQYQGQHYHR